MDEIWELLAEFIEAEKVYYEARERKNQIEKALAHEMLYSGNWVIVFGELVALLEDNHKEVRIRELDLLLETDGKQAVDDKKGNVE